MMIPASHAWLGLEPGPKMLLEGLKTLGTTEAPGRADNPTILAWAAEVGVAREYTADSVPWCGLWAAVVAKRAGKPVPTRPLWALNWAKWGADGGQPELGDVLVFMRDGGGHVGLYVGEDVAAYHVLGGNQGDSVSIARVAKPRLRACRQFFGHSKPPNVRPVRLLPGGALLSRDER